MSGIGVLVEESGKTGYAYKIKAPAGSLVDSVLDLDPLSAFLDTMEPTGFNRNLPNTMGIIELSTDGITIYSINQNSVFSKRTDGKFATGTMYETTASARTLVMFPVAGQEEFYVYIKGTKYTHNDLQSITFPNTSGDSYTYFNEVGLQVGNPFNPQLFGEVPMVSIIYGNATTGEKVVFSDERHGITMDGATHRYLHFTEGMRYVSGLDIQGLVASSTTYGATGAGIVFDEDIQLNLSVQTISPFWFIEGSAWSSVNDTNILGYIPSGTQVVYNQNSAGIWSLIPLPTNDYMCMHFMVSNDREYPIVKVLGQNNYNTVNQARDGILTEVSSLYLAGIPSAEALFIGSVIINGAGQLQSIDGSSLYLDLREAKISGSGNISGVVTTASNIIYDNTLSSLIATDVQGAIDELKDAIVASGGTIASFIDGFMKSKINADSIINHYSIDGILESQDIIENNFTKYVVTYVYTLGVLTGKVITRDDLAFVQYNYSYDIDGGLTGITQVGGD